MTPALSRPGPGRRPLDDAADDTIANLATLRRLIARRGPVVLTVSGTFADSVLEGSVRGVFVVRVSACGRSYTVANVRRPRKGSR